MRNALQGLLFLCVPLSVQAQPGIEWWPGSWEEGFQEAEHRNVPLLIAFIQDGEEANERIVAGLYKDPEFMKATERVVSVIASMAVHKPMQQEIRGTVESVCSRFGSVRCSVHREHEMMARGTFWKGGMVKTPAHIVVLPDGTEVDRLIDVHPTGAYVDMIDKARRKLGGVGLTTAQYREGLRLLRGATASVEQEDLEAALEALDALDRLAPGTPLAEKGNSLRETISGRVQNAMTRANELVGQKRHVEALRLLESMRASVKGTHLERDLKKALAAHTRTRAGREAARVLENEERAEPYWQQAVAHEQERDFVRATRDYYRVLATAGDEAPLGRKARARIDQLMKDDAVRPLIEDVAREEEAELLYRKAQILRRKRQRKEMEEVLKELFQKYPGTPAAEKAQRLVEDGG